MTYPLAAKQYAVAKAMERMAAAPRLDFDAGFPQVMAYLDKHRDDVLAVADYYGDEQAADRISAGLRTRDLSKWLSAERKKRAMAGQSGTTASAAPAPEAASSNGAQTTPARVGPAAGEGHWSPAPSETEAQAPRAAIERLRAALLVDGLGGVRKPARERPAPSRAWILEHAADLREALAGTTADRLSTELGIKVHAVKNWLVAEQWMKGTTPKRTRKTARKAEAARKRAESSPRAPGQRASAAPSPKTEPSHGNPGEAEQVTELTMRDIGHVVALLTRSHPATPTNDPGKHGACAECLRVLDKLDRMPGLVRAS